MSRGRSSVGRAASALGGGVALAGVGYAAYAAAVWLRYGRDGADGRSGNAADLLDRFMPVYEVEDRHATVVDAPASATFEAARAMDINRAPLVRAIFTVRTLPSRVRGHVLPGVSRSLVDETQKLGWRVLSEIPGKALVMGAYTQPWRSEVTFHGLAPGEFRAFNKPGYAKIVWTLEVEWLGPAKSRFVTRTRVATTDRYARERFRRYWAVMSPGILLIRRASLGLVKRDAEHRWKGRRSA